MPSASTRRYFYMMCMRANLPYMLQRPWVMQMLTYLGYMKFSAYTGTSYMQYVHIPSPPHGPDRTNPLTQAFPGGRTTLSLASLPQAPACEASSLPVPPSPPLLSSFTPCRHTLYPPSSRRIARASSDLDQGSRQRASPPTGQVGRVLVSGGSALCPRRTSHLGPEWTVSRYVSRWMPCCKPLHASL